MRLCVHGPGKCCQPNAAQKGSPSHQDRPLPKGASKRRLLDWRLLRSVQALCADGGGFRGLGSCLGRHKRPETLAVLEVGVVVLQCEAPVVLRSVLRPLLVRSLPLLLQLAQELTHQLHLRHAHCHRCRGSQCKFLAWMWWAFIETQHTRTSCNKVRKFCCPLPMLRRIACSCSCPLPCHAVLPNAEQHSWRKK